MKYNVWQLAISKAKESTWEDVGGYGKVQIFTAFSTTTILFFNSTNKKGYNLNNLLLRPIFTILQCKTKSLHFEGGGVIFNWFEAVIFIVFFRKREWGVGTKSSRDLYQELKSSIPQAHTYHTFRLAFAPPLLVVTVPWLCAIPSQ